MTDSAAERRVAEETMSEPSLGGTRPQHEVKTAPSYDPGFRQAVAEGYLTVQQAVQRGSRKAFAAWLVERHGLSEHQALLVADNRVPLREVARRTPTEGQGKAVSAAIPADPVTGAADPGVGQAPRRVVLLALVASALVVAAALLPGQRATARIDAGRRLAERPATRVAVVPPPSAAQVLTDQAGRVLTVSASSPEAVLTNFCRAGSGTNRLLPLELAASRPARPGLWLGLYRDPAVDGVRAIRIRQDGQGGRWVAGDGRGPLEPFDPDPRRLGEQRVAVRVPSGA